MENSKDYFFSKDAFQHYLQMNIDQKMNYDSFESKMLQKGIYGVLQPKITMTEAESAINCRLDLGAMWPCSRIFDDERCDWKWFEGLVLDLLKIQEQVCAHMLEVERIWWSWESIFYDWQSSSAYLIYLPPGGKAWIANETLQTMLMQLESRPNFPLRRHPIFQKLMAYCKNPYFCAWGVQELMAQTMGSVALEAAAANMIQVEPLKPAFKSKVQTDLKMPGDKTKKWVMLGLIQVICCILYVLCWVVIPQLTGDVGDALLGSFLLLGGVDLYICLKCLSKDSDPKPEAQKKFSRLKSAPDLKSPPQVDLQLQESSQVQAKSPVHQAVHQAVHPPVHQVVHPRVHQEVHPRVHQAEYPLVESRKITNHETVLLKPKAPKVYLIHQQTGEIYLLMQSNHRLGRNIDQVDCVLPSPTVGRLHAEIHRVDQDDFLRDLDSKNGTLINGVAIKSQTPISLSDGDLIQFGDYSMSYVKKNDE